MNRHIQVIGVGQEWRGDDAVGLLVARHLQRMLPASIRVQECSGQALDLLAAWEGTGAAILVDAVHGLCRPGSIYQFDAISETIPLELFPSTSTHGWGVAEALALGQALGRLPPYLTIYGIVGKSFGIGLPVSLEVKAAIDPVAVRVIQEITQLTA